MDDRVSDWAPSQRYPDPAVHVVDQSFARYKLNLAKVERLATGCRWSEGPVWFGDMRALFWSDIPNNRILRWDEETGAVTVFRKPSNFANGNTRDRQGRLVTCLHGGRSVIRTEHDGTITTVAEQYGGKRLNSPNDVVDGGTRITNKRTLIEAGPGTPDGFRCDVDGNLWCGWGMGKEGLDGVSIFNPDGKLIGRIDLPERCATLCFGGTHRNRLFMVASTSLYSLYVNTQGAAGG